MKGVSGKVITVVITLVLAVVAIVIVWQIYREVIFGRIVNAMTNIADEFARSVCKKIPILGYLC